MSDLNFCRLDGTRVYLASFRDDEEALKLYTKWINDENIAMFVGHNHTITSLTQEKIWSEKIAKENRINFSIIEKKDEKLIGTCDIKIKHNGVTCELGILIGDEGARNKGYGTEIIKMLIKYCFEELRAHRVGLWLNAENIRAHKCYLKSGLKDCGVEHEAVFWRDHYCDLICMEILEDEYRKQNS